MFTLRNLIEAAQACMYHSMRFTLEGCMILQPHTISSWHTCSILCVPLAELLTHHELVAPRVPLSADYQDMTNIQVQCTPNRWQMHVCLEADNSIMYDRSRSARCVQTHR